MVRPSTTLISVVATLILGACGAQGPASPQVVATTSILADVVSNAVGRPVESLIPAGAEPHDYRPSARQAAAVADAALVVANGLGLEQGLETLLDGAEEDGVPVLEVGPLVDPRPLASSPEGVLDPHVWLDPLRMARAVRLVGERLAELDPTPPLPARADAYAADLEALDRRIADILAAVPPQRRLLVTAHDSLGYFADRYGFRIVGTLVPGGSTLAEPNPADIAELVRQMDATGVEVIVIEAGGPSDLARAVAAESPRPIRLVELFIGSLGPPGSGADTYIRMMETNARRIADALG